LKGYVKAILSRLVIEKISNAPVQSDVYSEGTAITYNNDILVEMGVIKKPILKHFGIKQDVYYADFNWDLVLKIITGKIKYTEIPKYPEVRRDLALLIDEKTTYESIFNLAKQTEKALLKDVNLFDVYQGDKLPEGKKSYALSFTIQDNTKTLTDAQIDKIMSKLQQTFETELGASLR
jgi:phenylalanyl-tRNA synthetase beta chain